MVLVVVLAAVLVGVLLFGGKAMPKSPTIPPWWSRIPLPQRP